MSNEDIAELQRRALIREVDEEVRSDALKAKWKKYRGYVIAAIVLAILGAVIFEGVKSYRAEISAKDSTAFSRSLASSAAGDAKLAQIDIEDLVKNSKTGYAELASLRSVSLLEDNGKKDEAIALLYEIKDKKSFSEPTRNAATIALAQRLLDSAKPDYAAIKAMLAPLATPGSPWKDIADEILSSIKN